VQSVLGKYQVHYFRCPDCGTVQTENAWWLEEAYACPLAATDVGAVSRNIALARMVVAVRMLAVTTEGPCLDVGGGTGLLVRLLRDAGVDCYWEDRYAQNVFARGFEARGERHYALLTAFEVLEHLPDPLVHLTDWLARSDSVLLTTTLLPASRPRPDEWWYYAPETGQHVTIYTAIALHVMAGHLGARLLTDGVRTHLFTRSPVSPWRFRLAIDSRANRLLSLVRRRRSLLMDDYRLLTGKVPADGVPGHHLTGKEESPPCK